MKKDFQQFIASYSSASDEIKALIDSDKIGLFADKIVTEQEGTQKRDIIVSISNRILNITSDSELVDDLEQLGISSESIAKAKAFVEQKPEIKEDTPTTSIAEDLAEIEKSLHQISPVRTMASDGKQIGYSSTTEDTYSSSQSNIIDENK